MRGLPSEYNLETTKSLLESTYGLGNSSSDIFVRSVAYSNGYKGEKTATVTSKMLSQKLEGQNSQWVLDLPGDSHGTSQRKQLTSRIIIDTHFEGLTPLNSFEDNEEHQFE